MLVRLLYASRAAKDIDSALVESIMERSNKYNPAAGVTGILCYSGQTFTQVIEGSRKEVSKLFGSIVSDSRHVDVELLLYEEISERRFSSWTMGQVNLKKVNPSILLKYSEKPVFDPFVMGGQASIALLEELIASASIVAK
jgi:hypothetical protein